MLRFTILVLLFSLPGWAQLDKIPEKLAGMAAKRPVTDVKIRFHPSAQVAPFKTLVVQGLAYGAEGEKGETVVRYRRSIKARVLSEGGGWVSKPFAFQGTEDEKFAAEGSSSGWNIFAEASSRYTIKDCVLYTAPEQPGKYRVEVEIDGRRTEAEIEVTEEALSLDPGETVTFPPEAPSVDPYRRLAEHWAPFLAQETWFQPKSDMPCRFDFDGDWHGDNNWDSLPWGSSQAYVYYAAMETATHWFLIYNVFHARDYSDRCVIGTCHENDNEGIILTIQRDGSEFGRLQVMETLAHNNVYTFTADPAIRNGAHDIDGGIELYEGSHPAVFIESGGHGIYGTLASHSKFRLRDGQFDGTGITLIYKGAAERPKHASDRLVGYELLPIYDHWWLKAEEGKWPHRTFDAFFRYEPFGGRPGLDKRIGGAFMGRKEAENKAKPFWGWHDSLTLKRKILAVGQWAMDPAYAVSRNLSFPAGQPFSLDYTWHPFLFGMPEVEELPAAKEVTAAPGGRAPDATPEPPPAPPAAAEPAAETALAPAQPAGTPAPAPPPANSGQVEITVRVDGAVDLHLSGSRLESETLSGQPPSGESAIFSGPIPASPLASLRVSKLAGRGRASVAAAPSAANGFRITIRVEDPRGGADLYRLRVEWNR